MERKSDLDDYLSWIEYTDKRDKEWVYKKRIKKRKLRIKKILMKIL